MWGRQKLWGSQAGMLAGGGGDCRRGWGGNVSGSGSVQVVYMGGEGTQPGKEVEEGSSEGASTQGVPAKLRAAGPQAQPVRAQGNPNVLQMLLQVQDRSPKAGSGKNAMSARKWLSRQGNAQR